VEAAISRFRPVPYNSRREIAPKVALTLFDAGHILGSASALLEDGDGSLLLSGDLGRRNTPIIRDPNTAYPRDTKVDFVVVESTYGDREHPKGRSLVEGLRAELERALKDGGKVLIPAFSIGRTQELLYHLNTLYREKTFPGVPVIIDGPMGIDVTALYERHRDCYDEEMREKIARGEGPFHFKELYSARSGKSSAQAKRIDGPAIIIAGSGMCTGGRIMGHLREFLPDPKTDVLFVGYQAKGTLGRRLLDGTDRVGIDGERVEVQARVVNLPGFSAHADRDGLLHWLSQIPGPPSRVFVCHGEPEQSEAFSGYTRERLSLESYVPHRGEPLAGPLALEAARRKQAAVEGGHKIPRGVQRLHGLGGSFSAACRGERFEGSALFKT
jgi:metallo-beta-lactamase family protein